LGEEGLRLGELRFVEEVRYGLYHGRPRDLRITMWLYVVGGSRKAGRRTLDANGPRSPGIWPPASAARRVPSLGTGKGVGSSSPSKTPRAASGSPGSRSARPSAWGAAAYGAHHRPLVADAHGTARERRPVARGLSGGGCRLGESKPDRLGALAPGEARGSAATLSTSTTASGVGGYASGVAQLF